MNEYYEIDEVKLWNIARKAKLPLATVREFCLADWSEGQEHQDWLNEASVEEIADWVLAGR